MSRPDSIAGNPTEGPTMYENYRMPGEFEKRSNVYVTWLPDYIRAEGYDNRQPCVDVIKALLEYGDVTVNLNCAAPAPMRRLARA